MTCDGCTGRRKLQPNRKGDQHNTFKNAQTDILKTEEKTEQKWKSNYRRIEV